MQNNTKRMKNQIAAVVAVLVLGLFGIASMSAQQPPPPNEQEQQSASPSVSQQLPPAPNGQNGQQRQLPQMDVAAGVARVSFIHGDVSMQRGDTADWSAVTLNTPLMTGDKISTGDASRTELELDFANILRLGNNAQANLATLANNRIQVQVAQGLVNYSVLKGSQTDAEIDTPNVAVHPLGEGRYRIQINANGDSEVVVREGEAEVSTPDGSTKVHKGQLITIHGMGTDAQYKVTDAPSSDDWDTWNKDRDGIIYDAHAYEHTNRYYTGAGDLDPYGAWSEVPDYGSVWIPTVGAGWAPYRSGRWVFEPYYGWTWVSYEPWGWAPYHYGRWFLYGSSWAWWPGPIYSGYRPIWAPAYVSFFGFGRGIGVGFGFGSIGWLPIGPGDFFHPWWGGFGGRFGVVGLGEVGRFHDGIAPLHAGDRFSNLNNVMVNDRMRAGVSSVGADSFGRGSVAARTVSASDLRGARMMTGGVPVTPTRESMRASDRAVSPTSAHASAQQHFFSDRGASGGSFANAGGAVSRPATAASSRSFESQGSRDTAAQGWNRFGSQGSQQGAGQQNASRPAENQGQAQGGWQHFTPQSRTESSPAANRGSSGSQANSYRPPLNMSKPVVNQRAYSAPAYRAPSAPSYRAPSAPSGGGSRSAPRPSGGGHSSGGGRHR